MKRIAVEDGSPESSIRLEDKSSNTFENVKNCRETLKSLAITAGWNVFRTFYRMDQNDPSDVVDRSDASSGRVPLHSG